MRHYLFLLLLLCGILPLKAQTNLNAYKYILVDKQYGFQKSEDSYQINSLTKFLFERAGYTVLFSDDTYPDDLAANPCMALKAEVKDVRAFLKTKVKIDLMNCNNQVVYSSSEGSSKEKDFKVSYHEAIRKSFESIDRLNYSYNASLKRTEKAKSSEEVAPKKAQKELIKELPVKEIEPKKAIVESVNSKTQESKKETIPAQKIVKAVETKPEAAVKNVKSPATFEMKGTYNFPGWGKCALVNTDDGFHIIGGTENFNFGTIYKTSNPSVFIVKWVAFKQPQMIVLNADGNLNLDTPDGVKTCQRVN